MRQPWAMVICAVIGLTGCSGPGESHQLSAPEGGVLDESVPDLAFQRVMGHLLAEHQRGHVDVVPLGIATVAQFGRCAPGSSPCDWVTHDVHFPERLQQVLVRHSAPVTFLAGPPPLCRDEVIVGFTGARKREPGTYEIVVDLLDTRPPGFHQETERRYTLTCNEHFCEVQTIAPGEEPCVEVVFAEEAECAARREVFRQASGRSSAG
jgi:hypothetical protein